MSHPELHGRIQVIQPVQTFQSGFQKQVAVIDIGGRYPSPIPVGFKREKIGLLAGLQVGDCVTVGFALDGREHNGRFFTDVVGLTLAKQQQAPTSATPSAEAQASAKCGEAIDKWKNLNQGTFDKTQFAVFCQGVVPGKGSKDYAVADWQAVVDALNGLAADAAAIGGTAVKVEQGPADDLPW